MRSTIDFELLPLLQGRRVGVELPEYCGIPDIGFIWHNEWSDPELEYKGKRFNVGVVTDIMWTRFEEEVCEDYDEDRFAKYIRENADEVYEILDSEMEE